MRAFAIISGGIFVLAAAQQTVLPAPLTGHYDRLKAASNLTVDYSVRTIGEAPQAYKLVLSRSDSFKLTTPSGFVVSDGKTITTYRTATKTYSQEPYSAQWLSIFVRRPDVFVWGSFLSKNPSADVASAQLGAARTIQGADTTEVQVSFVKPTIAGVLFIDKKLGIVRGWTTKNGEKETLVVAKSIELGKEPMPAEQFAFVAPDGAKKEEVAVEASFAQVQAIANANCMPCHSADHHRANVVLDNYAGVAAIVTPGQPAASLFVKAVRGAGARKMPPGDHSLAEGDIKAVESWIAAGAKQ